MVAGTRAIEWMDGIPVAVYRPTMTNAQISTLSRLSLSLPYVPETNEDGDPFPHEQKFLDTYGNDLCIGEVAAIKRAIKAGKGDDDAYERILDRTIGKPKQLNENININVSLEQALDQIGQRLLAKGKITDVEIIADSPPPNLIGLSPKTVNWDRI